MHQRTPLVFCLTVLIAFFLVWPSVTAEPLPTVDFSAKQGYFTGKLGFIGSGRLKVDGREINSDPGFTFGVAFDLRLHRKYFYGLSVDIFRQYFSDTSQWALDAGLNLKRELGSSPGVRFRPTVGLGFAYLAQLYAVESTRYLTLRVGTDVVFYTKRSAAFVIDINLYATLWGGNHDIDVSRGISPLVRMGLML